MQSARLKLAVVGHVEWVQFARVPHVPPAGEVVHASEPFEEPAGGGAVAAVQLARLAATRSCSPRWARTSTAALAVWRLGELGVECVRASSTSRRDGR